MSKIGIYAPSAAGHRFKYVQYLIKNAPRSATFVIITTNQALQDENYKQHLEPLERRFSTHAVPKDQPHDLAYYSNLLQTDVMIIPDGDSFVWQRGWRQGWRGRGEVSALVMRPNSQTSTLFQRAASTTLKRLMFRIANARPNVHAFRLESSLSEPKKESYRVADPISFDPDQRALDLILPQDSYNNRGKWIGVVGAITERKNVELVLDAAKLLRRDDFGIILAGRIEDSLKLRVQQKAAKLQEHGVPVITIDRILTDGELDAILQGLNCVVLAHSNEGSSGILGKAVESGTFVVAAGAKSLRKDCNQLPNSSSWTPLTSGGLAASIQTGLDSMTTTPRTLRTEQAFAEQLIGRPLRKSKLC